MKTTLLRAFVCTLALLALFPFAAASAQTTASPAEARAIAKEAYIYGYPMESKKGSSKKGSDPNGTNLSDPHL